MDPIYPVERSPMGTDRFPEYYCHITKIMDKYNYAYIQETDGEYKHCLRTYIMKPEKNGDRWYISIRVPGATRGHLEVVPLIPSGRWSIAGVELYKSTAIIGRSDIGVYLPNIEDVIDTFIGNIIDFRNEEEHEHGEHQ